MVQRPSAMLVAILALPVISCYQARITNADLWFLDVPVDAPTVDPGDPDVPATETTDAADEVSPDAPLPDKDRITGSPCTLDDQCWTMQCLTTEFLQLLNPNLEAPGGMCSMIGCSADEDCGPGGKCADANAVSAGFPLLCVKTCAADADCGRSDGYGCPDLGVVDGAGAKLQGCLPLKLVELLLCDNGKCATEPKDPYCPATCPAAK